MASKGKNLKRGWTTGACAAAAAKAACTALLSGEFPDPVVITLPGGQQPAFALAQHRLGPRLAPHSRGLQDGAGAAAAGGRAEAMAAIVKDAGDDPDVTHGAVIAVKISHGRAGKGIVFHAGAGVGTVTLPGLPLAPGEPAINPVPRRMIAQAIAEVAGDARDFDVEISVAGGEAMAARTLNPRLGIVGGISILGTTGVVIPYSCAAWIDSIHRGIDVARAMGLQHVICATGDTSEKAAQRLHGANEQQLIEMGDFIGGTLKYIRRHPLARVTIAGGVAKMTKLAQGMLDVHSKRGRADMAGLSRVAETIGAARSLVEAIAGANTVTEAFDHANAANLALGDSMAGKSWDTAASLLRQSQSEIALEILIFDRDGGLRGHAPFASTQGPPILGTDPHDLSRPLKRR